MCPSGHTIWAGIPAVDARADAPHRVYVPLEEPRSHGRKLRSVRLKSIARAFDYTPGAGVDRDDDSVKVGQIVFLHQGGDLRVGRITAASQSTFEVEQPSGQRSHHGSARIARTSEKNVPTTAALVAYEDELRELIDQIDLDATWTLCRGDGPERIWTLDELAGLALPSPGPSSEDSMAWVLYRDRVYFRALEPLGSSAADASPIRRFTARPEDEVVSDKATRLAAAEHARRLDAMTAWLRTATAETPKSAEALELIESLEVLALWDDERPAGETARTVMRRLGPKSPEGDGTAAFRRLVDIGVYSDHENLWLRRSKLPREFPPDVLAEAEVLATRVVELEKRKDYRHLETVSIDDEYTTEIDDAFAYAPGERPLVYVFIADPAAWIGEGSLVDQEAQRRAATLYIPEGKVTMLPERIAEDAASLVTGQDREAMAFVFEVDDRGHVTNLEIEDALIRVDYALPYKDVDAILKGREHPLRSMLLALHAIADRLRAERRRQGSITLDRRDVSVHRLPDGKVDVTVYRTDDPARRLVAEFMIQTSCHAAIFCRERRVPAVYRGQAPPDERPVLPEGRPLAGYELQNILKTMRRAELSTEPLSHAGLGLPCYTQVTSPLRRYQDLLMQRQLRHVVRRGVPRWSEHELLSHFDALEAVAGTMREVERESRRFWILRHLEARVGQRVRCEVLRLLGKRVVVELMDFGVQAVHPTPSRTPNPGDTLVLMLKAVEARRDKITLG